MTDEEPQITTLHQAFDAYRALIERSAGAEATAWEKHRLSVVARLREEHPDEPLDELNLDRCAHLIDHWRNRPDGRNGNRLSRRTCANFLSELARFFQWLDYSPASAWERPRGFERLKRTVTSLPADRQRLRNTSVSLDQLRLLYRHADNLDRLTICLALNCGLGPSEMGRLTARNVICGDDTKVMSHVPNGHAILQYQNVVTSHRREHVLWPETLELLRWAMRRTSQHGQECLLVNNLGTPIFRPSCLHPTSAISNRIGRLVCRVRKSNPELASVTLKLIRQLGYELVRRMAGDELATLFLGRVHRHGVAMNRYAAPPFGQLHLATLEVRLRVEEMFESANDTCVPDMDSLPARTPTRDKHGMYTRHIGHRKFRLGTHQPTAERRFETISHLFRIMNDVTGDSRWTPFAQVLAGQIAAGKLTLSITKTNSSTQDNDSKGGAA